MEQDLYQEKAIPLIQYSTKTEQFEVNPVAIDFIKKIPQPLGVIAVAGTYRTGKSYLLNRMLLNRSTGFGVGPTINPCTKGLWIWGKPIIGQTPDGRPINVIVIDSEGIGSLSAETNHDSRIFSLALLLCSQFIYNSVGAIDENALEQLSLIVHLTKNIQIYADKNKQDVDSNDYAKYFPHFLWVLRDFTLQLVDEDGEPITPKEYLEKALTLQKGFSDGIENKNRIRRLLSTFFSERDCHTLVRPLTDEDNLQRLEEMKLDQLRPEFFEQVIQLRRKLLNRMHPKMLNGRLLNGEMLADICMTYCKAINEGAVPNIESAWTYICQNECFKAQNKALEKYETAVNDLLSNKLPLPQDQLKQYHKMAKRAAKDFFNSKAVGDISKEFKLDLNKKIKQHYNIISAQNEKECKRQCTIFITNEYQSIEAKLRNNEYDQYKEYLEDMEMFQSYLFENSPLGPERNAIILQHLLKFIEEASEWFMKSVSQELEVQNSLKDDLQVKLSTQLNTIKQDHLKEKQFFLKKIQSFEQNQAELIAQNQLMQEQNEIVKKEKFSIENQTQNQLHQMKQVYKQNEESLRNQLSAQEECFQQLERKQVLHKSEHEKEKALLAQKILFYEGQMKEQSQKEKNTSCEFRQQKKEYAVQAQELQKRYEAQNKELQGKIDELQDQNNLIQNDMTQQQHQFYKEKSDWYQKERHMKKTIDDQKQNLQVLQQNQQNLQNDQSFEVIKEDYEDRLEQLQQKLKEYEFEHQKQENIIQEQNKQMQKQKAILQQKNDFLKLELKESQDLLEEQKNSNSVIMDAFNFPVTGGVDESELKELEDEYQQKLQTQKEEFQKTEQNLEQKIQEQIDEFSQIEFQLKIQQENTQRNLFKFKEKIEELEYQKHQLIERNKILEKEKLSVMSENENKYGDISKQHEDECEQLQQQHKYELSDMQTKNEEQLAQLKSLQQAERDRLEQRNLETKEKFMKQLSQQEEEFSARLNEANSLHDEEVENLSNDLMEKQSEQHQYLQDFDHQMSLKDQNIDNLENHINDLKINFKSQLEASEFKLEQQIQAFQEERQSLMDRIDRFTKDIQVKDKQAFQNQQQIESLSTNNKKLTERCQQCEEEYRDSSLSLEKSLKETQAKLQTCSSIHLKEKIELERELALAYQQKEFLDKKNRDLQTLLKQDKLKTDEKIKQMRGELSFDMMNRLNTLQEEKTNLQIKYEKAMKEKKEIEQKQSQKIIELEREKAVNSEKLNNLEQQLDQSATQFVEDSERLKSQVLILQSERQKEVLKSSEDINCFKNEISKKDQEVLDLTNTLDKERELNEEKFKFLTAQKNQARETQKENQKKFEMMIGQFQKRRLQEIKEKEQYRKQQIQQLEQRHYQVLQDKSNYVQKLQQSHYSSIEQLKQQIQDFKSQLLDKSKNNSSVTDLQDKIQTMRDQESSLKGDLQDVKDELQQVYKGFDQKMNTQKIDHKKKVQDLDNQYKISQSKIQNLVYEHEKKRMQWNFEKDVLTNASNNLQDQVKRLQNKNQLLVKENEKLKHQGKSRDIRRSGAHQWGNSTNSFKTGFNLYTSKYRNRSIHNSSRRTINLGPSDDKSFLSKKSDAGSGQNGEDTKYILNDPELNDLTNKPLHIHKPPMMPKKFIGDSKPLQHQRQEPDENSEKQAKELSDLLQNQSPRGFLGVNSSISVTESLQNFRVRLSQKNEEQ